MRTADPRLLVLGAIALQSAVHGLMSGRIAPQESLLFDTVAFGLCTAIFVLLRRPGRLDRGSVVLMAWMNVLTAITFIGFYASLTLIPAATTAALETAVGPIAVAATVARSPARWVFAGTLGILATLLAMRSGIGDGWTAVTGSALAVLAGIAMAGLTVLSRRLGDRQVSPVTVTAHRFHLTYLVAATLWLATDAPLPPPGRIATLAGYGVIAVIVPLFLLQAGLQRTEPLTAMVIIVTAPSITYLVQVATGTPYDTTTFALILGIIAVSTVYNALRPRRPAGWDRRQRFGLMPRLE
jgi:drug/metabolite transporter (DMT)-like permease